MLDNSSCTSFSKVDCSQVDVQAVQPEILHPQPCSSQSNALSLPEHTTLCEMFPQLDDDKIQESLYIADNNIEVAISHILETSADVQKTPKLVCASLEFCNTIADDDDFSRDATTSQKV